MGKLTKEEFIERAIEIYGDKYIYSDVEYCGYNYNIDIICPLHGKFTKKVKCFLNKKRGCNICSGFKKTNDFFLTKAKKIHGDRYDYSLVDYSKTNESVIIICKKHGSFKQTPYVHLLGSGCNECALDKIRLNSKLFVEKAIIKHGNKYDYSLVDYTKSNKNITIICKKHGSFKQTPNNHLRGANCPKCQGRNLSKEEFIKIGNQIHNHVYDYSLVDFKYKKSLINIICPKHGEFKQKVTKHLDRKQGCPICNTSKGEMVVRNFLIENKINFVQHAKFSNCRNKRPLPFDFYLPELNICIEYDGRQHYEPVNFFHGKIALKIQIKKDKIKTEYCEDNGIKLLRIKYNENIINVLNENLSLVNIYKRI